MNNNFKNAAVTGKNDEGKRADKIIRTVLTAIPLSSVYKEIRSGRIRINSRKIKPDFRVKEGDIISIHISLLEKISKSDAGSGLKNTLNTESAEKTLNSRTAGNILKSSENSSSSKKITDKTSFTASSSGSLSPEKKIRIKKSFKDSIIFENRNILALNKKRGIPVHGGDFSRETETLEDSVKQYLEGKISDSITFSPGPLHRLDRNTSGIILFGKSIEGARLFSEMLRTGKTEKYYIALFDGLIKKETRWEDLIYQDKKKKTSYSADLIRGKNKADNNKDDLKGKKAVTVIKPIVYSEKNTLALVNIPTGRYHQIRKQGSLNSHPLTGDRKYSGRQDIPFYLLHALCLVLKEESVITGFTMLKAPLPEYFYKTAEKLFCRKDAEEFRKFIKNF